MVLEYRAFWNGGPGGEGVSVFHGRPSGVISDTDAAIELAGRVRALFAGLASFLPDPYTISFAAEVTELNTTTGVLEDIYAVSPGGPVNATGAGDWAAPAGIRVDWTTGALVAGRRLRGRTFFVPVIASCFDTNGSIEGDVLIGFSVNAATFYDASVVNDCNICVWSRTHGILADVTGHAVADEAAVLRSRRD